MSFPPERYRPHARGVKHEGDAAMTEAPSVIVDAIYPGMTQLDFTGPHTVFSPHPRRRGHRRLGGRRRRSSPTAASPSPALRRLADIERCDLLFVPGRLGRDRRSIHDEAFMRELRRLAAGARYVTSVCTGSLVLGAAGLLKGKRAACHWAWRDLLRAVRRDPRSVARGARRQRHHRRRRHRRASISRWSVAAELGRRDARAGAPARPRIRPGAAVRRRPPGDRAAGGAGGGEAQHGSDDAGAAGAGETAAARVQEPLPRDRGGVGGGRSRDRPRRSEIEFQTAPCPRPFPLEGEGRLVTAPGRRTAGCGCRRLPAPRSRWRS